MTAAREFVVAFGKALVVYVGLGAVALALGVTAPKAAGVVCILIACTLGGRLLGARFGADR